MLDENDILARLDAIDEDRQALMVLLQAARKRKGKQGRATAKLREQDDPR